ncbi:hypothetical protein BJV74DRAFT_858359, partial [Russula compacta]
MINAIMIRWSMQCPLCVLSSSKSFTLFSTFLLLRRYCCLEPHRRDDIQWKQCRSTFWSILAPFVLWADLCIVLRSAVCELLYVAWDHHVPRCYLGLLRVEEELRLIVLTPRPEPPTSDFVLRLDHLGTWALGCTPVQSPESGKVGPVACGLEKL